MQQSKITRLFSCTKIYLVLLVCLLLHLLSDTNVQAATFETGVVSEITQEESIEFPEGTFYLQELQVRRSDGSVVQVPYGSEFQPLTDLQRLSVGNQVIITQPETDQGEAAIYEEYRLPVLAWLFVGFFLLVLIVASIKGVLSILGMFISLAILMGFVVPQILAGANALLITVVAAVLIATVTVYLSHGWKTGSHIALGSILITLLLVSLLSYWFVMLAKLTGLGSEEATFLQVEQLGQIDLRGLLLSGIMLGALGVLDDIAVTQVATVFELKRANKKLAFSELYERGMRVGRDHVASLVNTLVLAYAGANLPLFMLFSSTSSTPAWVDLNSALIAEEVVRTLIGSMGLVAAVPITTALAAYFADKVSNKELSHAGHTHA